MIKPCLGYLIINVGKTLVGKTLVTLESDPPEYFRGPGSQNFISLRKVTKVA